MRKDRRRLAGRKPTLRIPVKWGTDSGDVGQCRSEATLVISMINVLPHMSQESCGIGV